MVWVRLGIGLRFVPPLSRAFTHSPHHSRGRMASGTVSCHRIYNVPPSAHSSSLGPSLAGPPAARTATAAEAMVATGGVSRSKLPTTCLLIEDHADLLTEYVNRGVPYHAESALSSAQESSAHAGALLNEHLLSCTAFCSQGSIAEVGSGARRSRFISPTSSNPGCTALTRP